VKRRAFVGGLVTGTATIAVGVMLGWDDLKARYLSSRWLQTKRAWLEGVDPATGAGPLSPDLERRLWSLAVVLLPSRIEPQGRAAVEEHLRWRALESPGYRAAFAQGLALLDQETRNRFPNQVRFGDLSREEANQVLTSLLAGIEPYPRFRQVPREVLLSYLDRGRLARFHFRRHVVSEILHAYYQSGAGWALVGYEAYPGRCGGPGFYSRPPRLTGT
jgi:hypothetical protein